MRETGAVRHAFGLKQPRTAEMPVFFFAPSRLLVPPPPPPRGRVPARRDSRLGKTLAIEPSEEWVTGRRYLDMEELEKYRFQKWEAEGRYLWRGRGRISLGGNYRNSGI